FTSKGLRAKEVLELVHSDVCGPISVQARGGYEYFITFTDDYSRYGYVYLMVRKSEALEKFKEFRNEAEKQLGKNIKTLRSDRGGEYLSNDFRTYLLENGIVSQLSAPGTPQQNGVSERRNRTLLDMARCMLGFSTLSTSFWGYAIQTAVYLLNMVPSKSVPKTPLELWNGRKPNLRHIRVWGCPAHVLKGKMEKMESRSEVCIFVGYPKGTRGYYFYSPQDKKVFVSTNATFLEDRYIEEHESKSKVLLEEMKENIPRSSIPEIRIEPTQFEFMFLPPSVSGPSGRHMEVPPIVSTGLPVSEMGGDHVPIVRSPPGTESENEGHEAQEIVGEQQSIPLIQEPPPLRRSGRVVRPPSRYLLYGESFEAVSTEQEEDPTSYREAMEDVDADHWRSAMDSEMKSMYTNSVWDLVDMPNGVKPIGCKWIYKRKKGVDGKVETFKARL
ncbi:hypothetical protein Pfo_025518, partial [Paulownia fortunei]